MKRFYLLSLLFFLTLLISVQPALAKKKYMSVNAFISSYNKLLAGKTLLTETVDEGITTKKTRMFGQAEQSGEGSYQIPVQVVVEISQDGKIDQRYTLQVIDKVVDHGGLAVITEDVVKTKGEVSGLEPVMSEDEEFNGHYIVTWNKKGGFDVWSFAPIPSIISNDDMTEFKLGGSMVKYSCYPEKGLTNCVLTIRNYKIDDYKSLEGFKKMKPHGDDLVEVATEVK